MRTLYVCAFALAAASCTQKPEATQCPDPAMVAPVSVGGASEVRAIASTLSGQDRENAIAEAVRILHQRDPALGSARITDILIAADCERPRTNEATRPLQDKDVKDISRRVEAIMSGVPGKDK